MTHSTAATTAILSILVILVLATTHNSQGNTPLPAILSYTVLVACTLRVTSELSLVLVLLLAIGNLLSWALLSAATGLSQESSRTSAVILGVTSATLLLLVTCTTQSETQPILRQVGLAPVIALLGIALLVVTARTLNTRLHRSTPILALPLVATQDITLLLLLAITLTLPLALGTYWSAAQSRTTPTTKLSAATYECGPLLQGDATTKQNTSSWSTILMAMVLESIVLVALAIPTSWAITGSCMMVMTLVTQTLSFFSS